MDEFDLYDELRTAVGEASDRGMGKAAIIKELREIIELVETDDDYPA